MTDEDPLEIPFDQLSTEALTGVIDAFVLREGTDYGHEDISLERKRAQVLAQLRRGEARLMFDARTATCTIVRREA